MKKLHKILFVIFFIRSEVRQSYIVQQRCWLVKARHYWWPCIFGRSGSTFIFRTFTLSRWETKLIDSSYCCWETSFEGFSYRHFCKHLLKYQNSTQKISVRKSFLRLKLRNCKNSQLPLHQMIQINYLLSE